MLTINSFAVLLFWWINSRYLVHGNPENILNQLLYRNVDDVVGDIGQTSDSVKFSFADAPTTETKSERLEKSHFLSNVLLLKDRSLHESCDMYGKECKCHNITALIGALAAQFTACAVSNARPITMCVHCIPFYLIFKHYYNEMFTDSSGHHCKNYLLDQDRANIISQVHSFVTNLWNGAFCDSCFHAYSCKNETVEYQLSGDYTKFFQLTNKTTECIQNVTHDKLKFILPMVNDGDQGAKLINSTKLPCIPCYDDYHRLNNFFQKLEDERDLRVCMDITDTMNTTRHLWTHRYKCHLKHTPDIAVIVAGSILLAVPAVFYFVIYRTTIAKEHKILKPKRFNCSQSMTASQQERY